jgi:hypothetical protein
LSCASKESNWNYYYFTLNYVISDEFKGHSLLEGARQTDLGRTKKYLEVVSFKHPYTGDTALVSCFIYFKPFTTEKKMILPNINVDCRISCSW